MATKLQTPNRLVAHEVAHGCAACIAVANCQTFAIKRSTDGLTCISHWPPVELGDQFAEVLAGPLFDLIIDGEISFASDMRDVAAAVLHWHQELDRPNASFAPDSDIVRSRRFSRALDGAEQFSAIELALSAVSVAYKLHTDHPLELTMLARRLDGLEDGEALVFTGAQIADAAAGKKALPHTVVNLHGWLAGTTERANNAMAVEAELIVRELNLQGMRDG